MLPKVFAIYRREEETFQLIQTEMNAAGEIQRLKGWRPPLEEKDVSADSFWDLGSEWYVEPTDYKGLNPILHNCIVHDKPYKWWSAHHKLVWSNYRIYEDRDSYSDWSHCHTIPILEFNNKHIYPREYVPVEARWASAMPQDLEEELDRARLAYLTDMHSHVDPSELRIQTPKEKLKTTYKRRAGSPMPSEGESDHEHEHTHEWQTEFTPCAPKAKIPVTAKHLNYMYDSQEDMEKSWTPCMALTVIGVCLFGTWSLIGMHLLGY
jgi:hypothetical protein